ncbi:MAG TPA: hypothetical protein VLZ83_00870 [Edaphocola sp.]|nr:hypothetical protein [Edaphocola sp.]
MFGLAISALVLGSCSSKDDINDTEIVVNPNVTDSKLDQKSGGVYFASTYAGEYIFRLNLKNGDDAMTCEMFHDDKYSKLAAPETNWQVGDPLEDFQFSSGDVKLVLSLNEDGEGEAQVFVEDTKFESVIFKSTAKEPVKVYSGLDYEEVFDVGELYVRQNDFVMVVIEGKYFIGTKVEGEGDILDSYRYTPELTAFKSISATTLVFLQPDILQYIEEWSWEREASYDEDRIYSYEYEDLENGNYYKSELTLHRRFKN